jgi:hypothetical protein
MWEDLLGRFSRMLRLDEVLGDALVEALDADAPGIRRISTSTLRLDISGRRHVLAVRFFILWPILV